MDSFSSLSYWLVAAGAVWFLWKHFNSAAKRELDNIPGPPSSSFVKGNVEQFFTRHGQTFHTDVAVRYGPVVKLHGLFGSRMLYISDPKALHNILIKEEQTFQEPSSFIAANILVFGPGLLSTLGDRHRKQRKMLNPVFSVAHMRHMLPIFYNVIFRLRDAIEKEVKQGKTEIDILGWCGRAALELIGQGGLGYSFDPLVGEMQNDYGNALKTLIPSLTAVEVLRRLTPYVSELGPAWLRGFAVYIFPSSKVQKVKAVVDTMTQKAVEIYQGKKKALQDGDEAVLRQVGEGRDIMSILIKANTMASEKDRLPEDELVGQMSTLIFAAMDTTSNALSRILQKLSENPDIQDRLRKEILGAGASSVTSYEDLNRLPLLDAVCRETLRVYPPATASIRVPNKDMVVPLSEPVRGRDGKLMEEITIPSGTEVIIGTMGSNLNKALWGDDAHEWKPDRWLSALPTAVTDAPIPGVYANLMTFLGGKRACIGFKFSEMEMKVVLSVMLSAFTFELSDKPIHWNVAGVWYPTVGKESEKPEMPLTVRLYKDCMA